MIDKLRRKIILGNVGMVAVLLAVIFVALCVFNWQHSAREVQNAMNMAQRDWEKKLLADSDREDPALNPEKEPNNGKDAPKRILLATVVASIDARGQILELDAHYMERTEEEVQAAVDAALQQGKKEGTLWRRGLRYQMSTAVDGGRTLVFADISDQFVDYTKLLGSMLVGFSLALIGLWYISRWMARQAVRPVERAWQSQQRFVADASHELKTPLTVILANGGILAKQKDATVGSQMQWVENTMEEARRMQKLVEDMLFLARSDDGGFAAEHRELSLSDLAWNVELPFEAVAYEQGVMLDSEIAEEITVSGDEAQLRRLIGILLDNACKYAGEGGRVMLTLTRQRNQACLTVQNTGPVIPKEQLARIFERFYRADASRARSQGGYGLGLSIAESIVKAHDGSIRVESSEKNGTVFTVLLNACDNV